jgi:hypothetical protein
MLGLHALRFGRGMFLQRRIFCRGFRFHVLCNDLFFGLAVQLVSCPQRMLSDEFTDFGPPWPVRPITAGPKELRD